MSNDINIVFLPLPVHGAVTKNEDGSYTIFINCNDSAEKQRETYLHECSHINSDDFCKEDVQFIEWKARVS